ncbi:MAG: alcohol dehydrogenase catalytic domain-containing protein, partial [Thermodesulfobacteriota bacterium]
DEIEGRTPPPKLPVIPGHQVVGRVMADGGGVNWFVEGDRVGVAWIYSACGHCRCCRQGLENLCGDFLATGRDRNGGYGEYMVVPETFVYAIPEKFTDHEAAPLLCGGAIGYRSLKLAGIKNGEPLGLTGFGASAHQVLQLAQELYPDSEVMVFARNPVQQELARQLGASWAGNSDEKPPVSPKAIIDTTPAWAPVMAALEQLQPGGRLVINAIRKEEHDKKCLLDLDYARHLWLEKEIKSVANICRADVEEFLEIVARTEISPTVESYDFAEANQALIDLKMGRGVGAKVLLM